MRQILSMRNTSGYIVLTIVFCFAFYFLCILTLQQQIGQRDTDLKQFICANLQGLSVNRKQSDSVDTVDHHLKEHVRYFETPEDKEEMDELLVGAHHEEPGMYRRTTTPRPTIKGSKNSPSHLPRCPRVLPGLEGKFDSNKASVKESRKRLRYGGTFKPRTCRAVERVAIIVPYRDRSFQLSLFLDYMHMFLQQQLLEYTIFVVEMELPTQFNRGLLANVGFMNADSTQKFTCFIFHDVDLLPANGTNMYHCGKRPVHMSVKNSKFGYALPYDDYLGGIVAFRRKQFMDINGFSNMYFGWGGEDDDLRKRLELLGRWFDSKQANVSYYKAITHDRDSSNPKNPLAQKLADTTHWRTGADGLNNLRYTRLAVEFRQLYTWIYVRAIEAEYMGSFTYLQAPPMQLTLPKAITNVTKTNRSTSSPMQKGILAAKHIPFVLR